MTAPRCNIPALTLPPCDLPWGHDGEQHANRGDGFAAREHGAEHRRRQEAVAAAAAFPLGYLAEVAAILRAGAKRHGCEPHETGGDQSFDDHLRHALDHVYGAAMGATDEPHLLHAAARLALAFGAVK
jgi:hypothetical protein